jgi:threonine/homoserine/homoserine lactone efflux protein
MFSATTLIAYVAACFLFSIVPGPSVAVVVANSLSRGTKAGFLTLLGTEISMLSMVIVVALGLQVVMDFVAGAFTLIKLVGAAYLIWIGWKMFTASGQLEIEKQAGHIPLRRFVVQGAMINWSNPKTVLFLGAFLPQFVDPTQPAFGQTMVLGLIVMAVATVTDGCYAVLAGRTRSLLTTARLRVMNRVSGFILIAGGVWMATLRRA